MSFSVAARDTENVRPAFGGFGEVVNAVTRQDELRQHLVASRSRGPGPGARSRWTLVKSGFPAASTATPDTAIDAELNPFVLPRSAAETRMVAPVAAYEYVSDVCEARLHVVVAVPLEEADRAGLELDRVVGAERVGIAGRRVLVGVQEEQKEHVRRSAPAGC